MEPGNEAALKSLCERYYHFANEYTIKGDEPVPKDMAQKLGLHIEEYSDLVNYLDDGGYQTLVENERFEAGGESINKIWNENL